MSGTFGARVSLAAGLLLCGCVGGEVHRLEQASEVGMQELKLF